MPAQPGYVHIQHGHQRIEILPQQSAVGHRHIRAALKSLSDLLRREFSVPAPLGGLRDRSAEFLHRRAAALRHPLTGAVAAERRRRQAGVFRQFLRRTAKLFQIGIERFAKFHIFPPYAKPPRRSGTAFFWYHPTRTMQV